MESRRYVISKPGPISKIPPEIITEVFKLVVLSSEEARSHGAKTLCRVCKHWNEIANITPDLWTKVTFDYPLHADQLSAARKWLRTSRQKAVDIEIDLCFPAWDELGDDPRHPPVDSAQLQEMVAVLRGSEHRWRSISVTSCPLGPIFNFLHRLPRIPSLPLLESISFEADNTGSRNRGIDVFDPPTLFGGYGTSMPKIQQVTLSGVFVHWLTAVTSLRNLRKLEIKHQDIGVCPAFKEFAALLAASPGLETLDITACSGPFDPPRGAVTPLVHLPALKHLVFGWMSNDFARNFLNMLQIPETLETLSLIDMGSAGMGAPSHFYGDPTEIFKFLADRGPEDPKDKDPSKPWIFVLGLKSLSISWVASDDSAIIGFLKKAPVIEEICLTDVSLGVLGGVTTFAETRGSLQRVDIRRIWHGVLQLPQALVATVLTRYVPQVFFEKFGEQVPVTSEAVLNVHREGRNSIVSDFLRRFGM